MRLPRRWLEHLRFHLPDTNPQIIGSRCCAHRAHPPSCARLCRPAHQPTACPRCPPIGCTPISRLRPISPAHQRQAGTCQTGWPATQQSRPWTAGCSRRSAPCRWGCRRPAPRARRGRRAPPLPAATPAAGPRGRHPGSGAEASGGAGTEEGGGGRVHEHSFCGWEGGGGGGINMRNKKRRPKHTRWQDSHLCQH